MWIWSSVISQPWVDVASSDARHSVRKETYFILSYPKIPFQASGHRSQLMGWLLSAGCALSLVMLQHHTILSIATLPIENSSSLQGTSAVHPAWGYINISPKLIPDCFASSFPSPAAPFLTPSCTWVVIWGLSAGLHQNQVVHLHMRFDLDAGGLCRGMRVSGMFMLFLLSEYGG